MRKNYRTFLGSVLLTGLLLLIPVSLYAQVQGGTMNGGGTQNQTQSEGLTNPLKKDVDSLPTFLEAILGGVIQIGTIILIMMLVYVGFLFVAARGNAEKLQSAKSALVWTVIGGLILLGAKSIQLVIEGTVKSLS
jgi:hypothetical protein